MNVLLDERIANCRARFAEQPESGVFVLLADLLRQRGDYEEALGILADGVIHRPESVAALVVLGRTLLEADRAEDARTALQRVLDLDRDNLVALRLMAEDCRSRAAWSAAVPYLDRLAELEPDEERWPAALEEARSFRDAPEPGEGETGAEAGFATLTLVDIYMAQGYHDRAEAALAQMLVANPGRAEVQQRLAILRGTDEAPPAPVEEAPTVEESEVLAEFEPAVEVEVEPEVEDEVEFEAEVEPEVNVEVEPDIEIEPEAEVEPEVEVEPVVVAPSEDLDDPEQDAGDPRRDRDERKKRFADWLNTLKRDGEGSP